MGTRSVLVGLVCLCLVVGACGSEEPPPEIGVQVSTLTVTGPQAGLPEGWNTLRFVVSSGDDVLKDSRSSIGSLSDLDGNGAGDLEAAIEIPSDTDVDLGVYVYTDTRLLATATARGIRVTNGARRYINLTFTPINEIATMPQSLPSKIFGHSAAVAGADGRLLITGGFDVVEDVTCPPELSESIACFGLEATDAAVLIDPASGALYETRSPMLAPRALHTSTSLPDGRVLIAGGVAAATLGFIAIEGGDPVIQELRPVIVAESTMTHDGAHRTFELFDPIVGGEETDHGHDGDPQAGAFVGAPGQETIAGNMNTARYLHAAALLPDGEGVLVVGGQGSGEASYTAEVFMPRRQGGAGFSFPPAALFDTGAPRVSPGAVTTSRAVFVMGGTTAATSTEQIGEIWVPGVEAGAGRFQSLSQCTGWSPVDLPRYSVLAPSVTVFGVEEERVLVAGWMGPLCTPENDTQESWNGTIPCGAGFLSDRLFTIGVDDCSLGTLQNVPAHALGAVAPLPGGRVLLAGGFDDHTLNASRSVDILTGEFGNQNLAHRENTNLSLTMARAWLTATPLVDGRIIFAGGMLVRPGASELVLSSSLEIFDPGVAPPEGR